MEIQKIEIEKELRQVQFANQNYMKTMFFKKMRKPETVQKYDKKFQIQKFEKLQGFSSCSNKFQEKLKCKICKGYFLKFTITPCGCAYCFMCIFESLLQNHGCPQCKEQIQGLKFIYCKAIDQFIIDYLTIQQGECFKEYNNRKKSLKEWKQKTKLQNVNQGDLIDVLDTEHIWCVGQILKISNKKKQKQILIHYQGWNKVYDEYISLNSQRLSPLGLYTNRKGTLFEQKLLDIMLYQPSQNENTLSNYVIPLNNEDGQSIHFIILHGQQQNNQQEAENINSNPISSFLYLFTMFFQHTDQPND